MTVYKSDPPGRAETIIVNAAVYTADPHMPRCEAVAIAGEKVIAAGAGHDIMALADGDTVIIDAQGRAVVPGMVDSHQHPVSGGRGRLNSIQLACDMDRQDYLDEIARFIALHPEKDIYTGGGFMPEIYDCCGPKKEWLDAICPDKPVIILSYDGHTTWVNSAALRLRGITKDTPDPENGVIHRDPVTGEPTGYLAGSAGACAGGMMRKFMPVYTYEQNREAILHVQEIMLAQGVTSVYDAHVNADPAYYMAYEDLAREGLLKLNVRGAWFIPRDYGTEEDFVRLIDECMERSRDMRTERFQVNGFKFLCDQVCECETAYLCEPYCDRCDDWHGLRIWEDGEMLARLFAKIDAAGFQIHLHQIGDGAAEYALDALEKAAEMNGGLRMRHTFAHCQFISDADKARMARLHVQALVAPYWMNTTIFSTFDIPHFGYERACRQYPVGSIMAAGVLTAAHSDYSVSMPDWCDALYGLTARSLSPKAFDIFYKRIAGARYTLDTDTEPAEDICCPLPSRCECIDIDTAVRCLTANGARSMYADHITGTIAPGMDADIVMLDRDIAGLAAGEKCARTAMTMCRGTIVYRS